MTEQELTDLLSTKAHHDLHDGPVDVAKVELDDEDIEELLMRSHAVLSVLIERKLPKQVQSDVRYLLDDLAAGLSWYRQM